MPNVAYFPIAYYAILRLGAVVVPMNPLLKAGEVSYAWNDAGVKVAVVFAMFAEEAANAAEATGTDVLVVTPGEFEQTLAGPNRTRAVGRPHRGRHGRHPLHLRHHRIAEGRRADPRQPRQQRRGPTWPR